MSKLEKVTEAGYESLGLTHIDEVVKIIKDTITIIKDGSTVEGYFELEKITEIPVDIYKLFKATPPTEFHEKLGLHYDVYLDAFDHLASLIGAGADIDD
jgi:hypothetical protein